MAGEKSREGYRVTLSAAELGIPGLSAFGHAAESRSELPMLPHRHREKLEVVLQLSGMRPLTVEGVRYTVYAGNAFLVLPGEEHQGAPVDGESGEIYWFQLDLAGDGGSFLGLSGREAVLCRERLDGVRARQLVLDETLAGCFAQAFRLLGEADSAARVRGHGLFLYALFTLLDTSPALAALTEDIDRAKRYILTHIREQIDMDELLLESGLPLREFREKFEREIGMKPRDYIISQKIASARRMVAGTRRSIADVAFAYHFGSVSIFRMHFKNETGMSPEKYRKQCAGKEGKKK